MADPLQGCGGNPVSDQPLPDRAGAAFGKIPGPVFVSEPHTLSPEDLEWLVVQICYRILGTGTFRFSSGPDGGRDGHAAACLLTLAGLAAWLSWKPPRALASAPQR